jgi:hypothetical protein
MNLVAHTLQKPASYFSVKRRISILFAVREQAHLQGLWAAQAVSQTPLPT